MARFTPRRPRANPPICWICDRKLYANGRSYEIVLDEQDRERPAHRSCAQALQPDFTVRPLPRRRR